MPKYRKLEVVQSVEKFGKVIELYNDGQYLITLRNGHTLWADCCDLEDIYSLIPDIFRAAAVERNSKK